MSDHPNSSTPLYRLSRRQNPHYPSIILAYLSRYSEDEPLSEDELVYLPVVPIDDTEPAQEKAELGKGRQKQPVS